MNSGNMPLSTQDKWLPSKFTWKDLFFQTWLWQKLHPWPGSWAPIHIPLKLWVPAEEAVREWRTTSNQILPHQTGFQFSVEEVTGARLPYHTHQSPAFWGRPKVEFANIAGDSSNCLLRNISSSTTWSLKVTLRSAFSSYHLWPQDTACLWYDQILIFCIL